MRQFPFLRGAKFLTAIFLCAVVSGNAAETPQKNFALDIVKGSVPAPQRILKVEKGDAVNLTITSDAAGELHLHGYRLAAKVTPGQAAALSFTAYATGRYPFEWHGDGQPTGGSHRGPPLAAIEVRPK